MDGKTTTTKKNKKKRRRRRKERKKHTHGRESDEMIRKRKEKE